MNTQWTTKEEYLQFVKDWKVIYKNLSAYIGGGRRDRKLSSGSNFEKATPEQRAGYLKRLENRRLLFAQVQKELGHLIMDPSEEATQLLALRAENKVLAGEARAASIAARKAKESDLASV